MIWNGLSLTFYKVLFIFLPSSDLSGNDLVDHYHGTLLNLIDKHAPVCSAHVKFRQKLSGIMGSKIVEEKYEHQWLMSGKQEDLHSFKNQRNLVKYICINKKALWGSAI